MSLTCRQWKELSHRAESGNAEAQWEVGALFEVGLNGPDGATLVRRNPQAAVFWYRRSAQAGNASAQINLGNCLSTGRGVCRDDAEALRWYKRALRQGDSCAANNIATIYRDRGDESRALLWYKRAVSQGDDDAWVEVGKRLYAGIGSTADAIEAVRCFRKAIASKNITQAGREEAMFHLGIAYYEGRGVRRSPSRAIKWLCKSNQDGDRPKAEELVGMIKAERRRTRAHA